MVAALSPSAASTTAPQAASATRQAKPSFFHRLLSELNPLQYLPVVGTIYRAVTGDVISPEARFAGSLVVSGLTSGPIGIGINLGTAALERLTGVDPEAIGSHLLADIGIGGGKTATPAYTETVLPAATLKPVDATPVVAATGEQPWSVAQLAAYGVRQDANGTMTRGSLSGADVLNSLELTRLADAKSGSLLAATA